MKCNMGLIDRIFRFFLGIILMAWVFAGGPPWGYLGLVLLITSGWGYCPLYTVFHIKTLKEK